MRGGERDLVEIWLPYGSSEIPARVPEERLVDILKPNSAPPLQDPFGEAKKLVQSNERLQQLARDAKRVCLLLSRFGNRELAVSLVKTQLENLPASMDQSRTILLTPDAAELESALPDLKVLRHNPVSSPTVPVESYKSDFPVLLNSEWVTADLRVVIGELKPHHFLNYTGFSDAVFPGIASEMSVRNHLSNRVNVTVGGLSRERIAIAGSIKNTFGLGLVIGADSGPAQIVMGTVADCVSSLEGLAGKVFSREVAKPADIVVMSPGGAPFDETLLRAVEMFPSGLGALKRNGVLIVAAECGRGHGDTEFYGWTAERKEPRYLDARLRHHFTYDGFKAAFLGRTLQSHRVYLVSTIPDYYVENIFGMKSAHTVNAALQTAQRAQGSDSRISVIPDASRVVTRPRETTGSIR